MLHKDKEECLNPRILFNRGNILLFHVYESLQQDHQTVIEKLIEFTEYYYNLENTVFSSALFEGELIEDLNVLTNNIRNILIQVQAHIVAGDMTMYEQAIRFEMAPAYRLFQDYVLTVLGYLKSEEFEAKNLEWSRDIVRIGIIASSKSIVMDVTTNKITKTKKISVNSYEKSDADYLFYWFLEGIKPIFSIMPIVNLEFNYKLSEDVEGSYGLKKYFVSLFKELFGVVNVTNRYMGNLIQLKESCNHSNKSLFYILDSEEKIRMGDFIKYWSELQPDKVVVKTFPSGWNNKLRKWEKTNYRFSTLKLIETIIENDVRCIIGMNHYYVDNAISHEAVYITAILELIGVKVIHCNFDPVEFEPYGQLRRLVFTTNAVTRLSVLPILSHEWDQRFDQANMRYTPIIQHYDAFKKHHYKTLDDDYQIIVMSQSRINYVKKHLLKMLFVFEHLDRSDIFRDYQLWFLAMRKLLIGNTNHSEQRTMRYGELLHELMYSMVSFFKYDVISQIKTQRKILIYGDIGWGITFPNLYQGKYLNAEEMSDIDRSNNYLHLLFHNSFSYLETGGPIYDALAKGRPFINYSALAKTPSFEGFSAIEYSNYLELNQLIDNYKSASSQPNLSKGVDNYFDLMEKSEFEIANLLLSDIDFENDTGTYFNECKNHYELLLPMVDQFILNNYDFLITCEKYVYENEEPQFDIKDSHFFERDFVKTIHNIG